MAFTLFTNAWELIVIYAKGLWLLFAHPHKFLKFAQEFRRFEKAIERADGIRKSEYFWMTRAVRRRMDRWAAKKGLA